MELKTEYLFIKNRVEELDEILINYRKGTLSFTPKYNIKLLDGQMRGMLIYKAHLEERARIEEIDLLEIIVEEETFKKVSKTKSK